MIFQHVLGLEWVSWQSISTIPGVTISLKPTMPWRNAGVYSQDIPGVGIRNDFAAQSSTISQ